MPSPTRPVVAIAGASGHLGLYIAKAVHEQKLQGHIKDLIILARAGPNRPDEINDWDKAGTVAVRAYHEDGELWELKAALVSVDVLINTIGSAGYKFRDRLLEAVAQSDVKLYFPSEFGVDHTVHDFHHPEWDHKKEHMKLAKENIPNVKICRVFAGLFLEDSIGPWFGFNTKDGVYECFGGKDVPVSYTSLDDVGKAVGQLLQMTPEHVPDQVHLSGDVKSFAQIATLMGKESRSEIKVVEKGLAASREQELKSPRPDPSGCLRFLMGEGKINHSANAMGCDNELVNQNESRWKWKTLAEEAKATGGRPWAD